MFTYLNIFEDCSVKQSFNEPSQEDKDCIDAGILSVIRNINNKFEYLNPDGTWTEVESV